MGKQMKKSGKTNRVEPTELNWIDKFSACAELFENAGWLDFFKKFDGYNTEVSHKFAQCYNQDTVSFDTLKFKLTVELVAEAIGFGNEGELWFKKVPFYLQCPKVSFAWHCSRLEQGIAHPEFQS